MSKRSKAGWATMFIAALSVATLLAAYSWAQNAPADHDHDHDHDHPPKAIHHGVAVIHATQGNQAHGVVHFTEEGGKVKIVAHIEGLSPNGVHGFHVHEFGDCSAPDASSAGGHYNPEGHDHAGPGAPHRHAGDLGNIKADGEGKAHLELTVDNVTIAGAKNPILGRGLIVHAKADDLKTQPTGDAGGRIGCGVIGVAK